MPFVIFLQMHEALIKALQFISLPAYCPKYIAEDILATFQTFSTKKIL